MIKVDKIFREGFLRWGPERVIILLCMYILYMYAYIMYMYVYYMYIYNNIIHIAKKTNIVMNILKYVMLNLSVCFHISGERLRFMLLLLKDTLRLPVSLSAVVPTSTSKTR